MRPVLSILLFLTLGIQACSPLHLLNNFVPGNSYTPTNNISYGQHTKQKLDIYTPANKACINCSVLVFFHGGAWYTGEKEEYKFLGEAFASERYIVVIPEFRLYPDVLFPVFIEDAAQSIRWVRDNIHRYGGNPDNINLMGHSSGAHITMMLAFDQHYLKEVNVPLTSIKSVIGLAGIYDFLPSRVKFFADVFTNARPQETGEPIYFASSTGFPVLLATGLKDKRVNPVNSSSFAEKIKQEGGKVTLITYPETGHSGILLSLSRPLRYLSPAFADSLDFLRKSSQ